MKERKGRPIKKIKKGSKKIKKREQKEKDREQEDKDRELEKLKIEAEKMKIEAARKDKEMEMEKKFSLKKGRSGTRKNGGRDHFTFLGAQREKFKS